MNLTKQEFLELNMELTLDQALKQGIEAHKAGQVQEADRLRFGLQWPRGRLPPHPLGMPYMSLTRDWDYRFVN